MKYLIEFDKKIDRDILLLTSAMRMADRLVDCGCYDCFLLKKRLDKVCAPAAQRFVDMTEGNPRTVNESFSPLVKLIEAMMPFAFTLEQ